MSAEEANRICARYGCGKPLPARRRKWCSPWCAKIGPSDHPPSEYAMGLQRRRNVRAERARRTWAKTGRIY